MPTLSGSVVALHPARPVPARPVPVRPVSVVPYDGPRIAAADYFTLARRGRAATTRPPYRDGDSVSCPRGREWMRKDGRWIIPGQPHGLVLVDQVVTGWWRTRTMPGSRFALVHRLTPAETTRLITGDHYTRSTFTDGTFTREPVTGAWVRSIAWRAARTSTHTVHLELPTGIVTLHTLFGDMFFHPTPTPAVGALCA
ncbi:hypothetical protein ACFWGI_39790 [Streptomyces niveus]|uniref:hypothetical protein n=1 Tax=Streptomyces niveus TaxID=193462 RepID=UPI00365249A5